MMELVSLPDIKTGFAGEFRTSIAGVAKEFGIEVHAGHGLTFTSAKILSKIKGIQEFNIGHFLIGESVFHGLPKVIKNFKRIIRK